MPKRFPTRIAGFALAASALAIRLVYLLRRPFWFDEIFTLWISKRSPSRILQALRLDPGPPLFYWLEHPVVRASEFLGNDSLARSLAFVAIGLLFLANIRRETSGGPRFPVLLATCPLLFFYSGEARAYALLSTVGFTLFLSAFRMRERRGAIVLAVLCAGLLPWIHYLGALVVAGSIFVCATRGKWRLAAVQAVAVIPFLLWLPIALHQPAAALAWSEEGWRGSVLGALGAFGFWSRPPVYFSGALMPAPWAGAIIGAALIGGAILTARRDRAVRDALVFAAAPLLLAGAAGSWRPVYFAGRTEMAVLPVALWAFARAARKSAVVRVFTSASAALGTVLIFEALIQVPARAPYAVTAELVSGAARAGDLVVASDADYLPLRERTDRDSLACRLVGIPEEIEQHPGWFEPDKVTSPAREQARLQDAIRNVARAHRVFFAVPPDPAARDIIIPSLRGQPVRIVHPPGGDSVLVLER